MGAKTSQHATKKSPTQLDREIAEALGSKDKPTTWMQRKALHDRGEHAHCGFLLAYLPYHEMAPYKSSSAYGYGSYEECYDTRELATRRLQQLRREGRIEWAKIYQHDPRYPLGRKLVDEWDDSETTAHATKRAIPGVSKWNMTAGGTGAAEGKHGYSLQVAEGHYYISPYTTRHGRHAGYLLKFAATGGKFPRGSHTGLWHDLGSFASPQKAATAAAKHHAGGFS